MDIGVRPAAPADLPVLRAMLWEAAAVSTTVREMGREAALALPSVSKYLDGWGRPGDLGVVAVDGQGGPLGAAWVRLFPASAGSYGFVAPDVPELTIGVAAHARGQGAGTALLRALLDALRAQGVARVSLSVDRQNPARALYERLGFRDAGVSSPHDTSVTLTTTL